MSEYDPRALPDELGELEPLIPFSVARIPAGALTRTTSGKWIISTGASSHILLAKHPDGKWRAHHRDETEDPRVCSTIELAAGGEAIVATYTPQWLQPAAAAATQTLREIEEIVRETYRRAASA